MLLLDARERQIRKALRGLAKQRVAMILQPGNVWVIECAVSDDESTQAALLTCYMRGWVEPLEHAIPSRNVSADGSLPTGGPLFDRVTTYYRLTDSGWNVINRAQLWVLAGVFLAALAIVIGVVSAG